MEADAIPIIGNLTVLWNATYDRVRCFPKFDRLLFGQRLLDDLDACTHMLFRALNDRAGRPHHLTSASAYFDHAKLRFRIAARRGLISERWYAEQIETIATVGRMLGRWQQSPTPTHEKRRTSP